MLRLVNTLPLVLLLSSQSLSAAVLIDISLPGSSSQIMMDGDRAMIGMGERGGDVLIDYKKQTMFVIDSEQKQILDMSGDLATSGGKAAINIVVAPQGTGPVIAGYATTNYTIRANNKVCGSLFGSKTAMQIAGISRLFDAMKSMADKQRAAMGNYARLIDVCTRATMDIASLRDRVGVPMKMLDNWGNLISEIKSINTNASLPVNAFVLPQGYKIVPMGRQLNQAGQNLSKTKRQMPAQDRRMNQLQQSGRRLPPQAMEQLKRY